MLLLPVLAWVDSTLPAREGADRKEEEEEEEGGLFTCLMVVEKGKGGSEEERRKRGRKEGDDPKGLELERREGGLDGDSLRVQRGGMLASRKSGWQIATQFLHCTFF